MNRYSVRSIGLGSVLKFSLLLGIVANLLPAALSGLVAVRLVTAGRQVLEGASQSKLTFIGQNFTLNLVEIAKLGPTLESLRLLDGLGIALTATVGVLWLGVAVAFTVVTALIVAVFYNMLAALTGGLHLDLELERK